MEYGLIGGKLGHSYSKEIHEQIADYEYELKELKPEELDGLSGRIRELLKDESYGPRIAEIRDRTIANFGRSGEVGGQYLIDTVKEQVSRRQEQTG